MSEQNEQTTAEKSQNEQLRDAVRKAIAALEEQTQIRSSSVEAKRAAAETILRYNAVMHGKQWGG